MPVRRRKTAAVRNKAKGRRPTHIYNTWRENPEQVSDTVTFRFTVSVLRGAGSEKPAQHLQREVLVVGFLFDS